MSVQKTIFYSRLLKIQQNQVARVKKPCHWLPSHWDLWKKTSCKNENHYHSNCFSRLISSLIDFMFWFYQLKSKSKYPITWNLPKKLIINLNKLNKSNILNNKIITKNLFIRKFILNKDLLVQHQPLHWEQSWILVF